MTQEKIANRQLWFLLFILRTSIVITFLPVLTTANALNDAWISTLLVLVGSIIVVFLVSFLDSRFPDLTIIEYSQKLLGYWPGKLLSIIFLWLFLQIAAVEIRMYAEIIATAFLPNTPLGLIIGVMVLSSAICVYQGIEVLGRSADFLSLLYIFVVLIIIIIPLSEVNLENIQPVLARGWGPVFSGSLTPIALMIQIWVLGMLGSTTVEPQKVVKIAVTSVAVAILILLIVVLLAITVLGAETGSRAAFPLLTLMRSVEVSPFLQRAELIIMFVWAFGLFLSVSVYIYSGAKGLSQWLGLNEYRPFIWPMAVIWVVLSIHGFKDVFVLQTFLKVKTFAPYGFTMLIIPLVLLYTGYGIKLLKDKKGD